LRTGQETTGAPLLKTSTGPRRFARIRGILCAKHAAFTKRVISRETIDRIKEMSQQKPSTMPPELPPGYGRYFGPNYYGEQDENGIDLSLIRENLKRSPLERIRRAAAAECEVRLLLEVGRRHRENAVRANR